jgi:hemoglobin/transferrin/lactoferrin receptor protein
MKLFTTFISILIINHIFAQVITAPEIEVLSNISSDQLTYDTDTDSFYGFESKEIIGNKALKSRNVDHVSELLQSIPGVSIVGGATPQFKVITIRGMSGYRVIQQVDGARRYEQTQGSLSSDIGVEADSLKLIQVEKGAESITKASGAIGGAVIYKTLDPSDLLLSVNDKVASKVKVSYSSASQSFAESVTTAAKIKKQTAILLQAVVRKINRSQSGGDEDQSSELDYTRNSYMAKLENKSAIGKVVAKASYTNTESMNTSYRKGFNDSTSDYKDKTTEGTIEHQYISTTNPLINLKTNLYANSRESQKITNTPWLGYESTVGATKDIIDQLGAKVSNRSVVPIGKDHFLESEVGLAYSKLDTEEIDGAEVSYYGKSRGQEQGIFAMNNLSLFNDTMIIKVGGRINKYRRRSDKLAVEVDENNGSTFSNVLGLTLKPVPFLDIFGKLSNTNRAPEVRELYLGGGRPFSCHFPRKICNNQPNSKLSEEMAYGREIGIKLHSNDDGKLKTSFKLSYFYEQISDYIEAMPNMYRLEDGTQVSAGPNDATHRDYSSINLNSVLRSGVEAQFKIKLYDLNFSAKYSAMNIDCKLCPVMYSATTTSEPLFTAPADKLVSSLSYTFNRLKLNVGYRGEFVKKQKRLSERYLRAGFGTPGYSTHSVLVGWEPTFSYTGRIRADLALENLTNKKYRVHNSGSGTFELGQSLKVSLSKYF